MVKQKKKKSSLPRRLTPEDIDLLLEQADDVVADAHAELDYAQPIAMSAGLTVHSSILEVNYTTNAPTTTTTTLTSPVTAFVAPLDGFLATTNEQSPTPTQPATTPIIEMQKEAALAMQARQKYNPLRGTLSAFPTVLATTAGHSNTDHIIHQNPDGTLNKFSEYKRRMKRRFRQTQLEERGSDRWDIPKVPGGRRRRIKRDADAPSAPPEPPTTGYVIYVSQMTTKLRHDNPERTHNQISAVRRISKMWKKLTQPERDHYIKLTKEARLEYADRLMEYRATGKWKPYSSILRIDNNKNGMVSRTAVERNSGGNGPWVRIPRAEKNELEKELDAYPMVIFPPRPKGSEEDHVRKTKECYERRKMKIRNEGLKYY